MKIAFMSCKNATHPCGGAAVCMRMFRERIGEFAPYSDEDLIGSVFQCDYCTSGDASFERITAVLKKEEIGHIHLAACTSICSCGNYEKLKEYWSGKGLTLGEYKEEKHA